MDAFVCKGVVATSPFEKSRAECKGKSRTENKPTLKNEPPLKKQKQDTEKEENERDEIIIIEDPTPKEKKEKANTSIIEDNNDNLKKNGKIATNHKKSGSATDEKKDDVSPPKQKRRKLTAEEKEAQLKQKEEARLLREKLLQEKQLEKERKEKEKEELRIKREKEREKERLEKQAKKEQLEKERLEKQKKKEELLQAKEEERKKKEEERKQKEEERKQKEEERKKKEEERKLKEEERKLKEEERKLRDEEELRKKEKVKSAFRSFFIKKSPPKKVATGEQTQLFAPFEIKPNMVMAPLCRGKRVDDQNKFDEECNPQEKSELYLSILRTRCLNDRMRYTTRRDLISECKLDIADQTDDLMVVDSTSSPPKDRPKREIMRVKLLQFSENYRPAYYGTWRKRSKLISPKNPFKKDKDQLNYEVDSDEEWEEEEPGESLSGPENDDDEEEEGDDDEDDDGFFVPHGYLSDDEGINGSDGEQEEAKVDIRDKKLDKTEGFPFDKKSKSKQHKATCFGSSWFTSANDVPDFLVGYKVCPMLKLPLDLFEIRQSEPAEKKSPTPPVDANANIYRGSIPKKVPEEAMHLLINYVHKCNSGLNKLVLTFLEFWRSRQPKNDEAAANAYPQISKRQLEKKILEIAKRESPADSMKSCYLVHQEIRDKYAAQLETCIDVKEAIADLQQSVSVKSPTINRSVCSNTLGLPSPTQNNVVNCQTGSMEHSS